VVEDEIIHLPQALLNRHGGALTGRGVIAVIGRRFVGDDDTVVAFELDFGPFQSARFALEQSRLDLNDGLLTWVELIVNGPIALVAFPLAPARYF